MNVLFVKLRSCYWFNHTYCMAWLSIWIPITAARPATQSLPDNYQQPNRQGFFFSRCRAQGIFIPPDLSMNLSSSCPLFIETILRSHSHITTSLT